VLITQIEQIPAGHTAHARGLASACRAMNGRFPRGLRTSGTVALTADVLGQAELMRRRRRRVPPSRSSLAGFRFPREVIVLAVRWYLRSQSYRDVEELLAERGVRVDHVTICECRCGAPGWRTTRLGAGDPT
jgi:hypothetical protein